MWDHLSPQRRRRLKRRQYTPIRRARSSSSRFTTNNLWTASFWYCVILLASSSSRSNGGWWSTTTSSTVTAWSFWNSGLGASDAARLQQSHGGSRQQVPFVQAAATSSDVMASSTAGSTAGSTTTATSLDTRTSRQNNPTEQPRQSSSSQQRNNHNSRLNFPWTWLFGNRRQNQSTALNETENNNNNNNASSIITTARVINDLTLWNRGPSVQLNRPLRRIEKNGYSNNNKNDKNNRNNRNNQNNDNDPPPPSLPNNNNNPKPDAVTKESVRVISYQQRCRHGLSSITWTALNTSPAKFQAFLRYRGVYAMPNDFTTQQVVLTTTSTNPDEEEAENPSMTMEAAIRDEWRKLWKQERLLADRTELLAVFPHHASSSSDGSKESDDRTHKSKQAVRRGGFVDHLYMYVDRLLNILRDEQEIAQNATGAPGTAAATTSLSPASDQKTQPSTLADWLVTAYGKAATRSLYAAHLCGKAEATQLVELKAFLEWFRSNYPYYNDRCGSCGASLKEELAALPANSGSSNNNNIALDDHDVDGTMDNEADPDDQCFVGYLYPNSTEVVGKASRTELYQCHRCSSYTRFPRYNSAFHVINSRRGRCGEYSVLLFEILRALGHEDWTDHVWVEIKLIDARGRHRWVHMDPCEAAVDENYLYQSWGKKQTHILAFYAPRNTIVSTEKTVPLIEDVTKSYTTDSWSEICKRRVESEDDVKDAIESAASYLRRHLEDNNYAVSSSKLK